MNKTLPLIAALVFLPFAAHASLITQALDFNAGTQSLWGSGSSADFGTSDSGGFGPVGFSYNIGASSGTVEGKFQGNLSVDYTPYLTDLGTTSLSLGFLGDSDGGRLKSDLGAWVKVDGRFDLGPIDVSFGIIDKGYALNIDKGYDPKLDQQITGSDSTTIGGVGLDVLAAKVGADSDIEQTDKFTASAIDGVLAYALRGSGTSSSATFSLDTDSGLTMDIGLTDVGIWDFWFEDVALDNLFSTSFDAELVVWENHRGCGSFPYSRWCGKNGYTLADIGVYDGDPFALDFNSITTERAFSIQVGGTQVPEPTTLALMGLGLAGIGYRRHRSKKTA